MLVEVEVQLEAVEPLDQVVLVVAVLEQIS
jgi:hypothetical protein